MQDFFNQFLVKNHDLTGADANYTVQNLIEVETVTIQVSSDKDYAPDGTGTTKVKILVMDTDSIISINLTPTAGGTGYTVGDILKISEGASGTVRVIAVTGGVVDTIKLITGGINYTTGAGKVTTGGTGTGCTIEITHAANFVERTALLVNVTGKNETHTRAMTDFDGRHISSDIIKGNATAGAIAIHVLGKR